MKQDLVEACTVVSNQPAPTLNTVKSCVRLQAFNLKDASNVDHEIMRRNWGIECLFASTEAQAGLEWNSHRCTLVGYVTVHLGKFTPTLSTHSLPSHTMTSTVLVTGASGFLGRAVFNTFQHSGVLVVGQGFSRAAPPTILKADLEKNEDIQKLFDEVKCVFPS
jgi:hypothetical protein